MNNFITDTSRLAELLVNTGTLLLKSSQQSEWLDVDELLKLSKQHNILVDSMTADELESGLKELLSGQDEIYVGNVNMLAMERRVGWELIFMLRFYRYQPRQSEVCQIKEVSLIGAEEVAA